MAIVDPGSQAKEMEKEVAKYAKLKKDFFDTLFIAHKKDGSAYFSCVQILAEGKKEIAKARQELADCIQRYDDCVKQTNRNRELMRQIGKGLETAIERLDPIDKDIKEAAEVGDKMLKINKNHAALTSALGACTAARKDLFRVGEKANGLALECKDLKAYEPIGQ